MISEERYEAAKKTLVASEERRRNGDFGGAIDDCSNLINQLLEPGALRSLLLFHAYICRGSAFKDQGSPDDAINDFSRAIQIDPESSTAYFHRAIAWEERGEVDQALDDYSRAIRLDPENRDAQSRRTRAQDLKQRDA